MKKFFDPDNPVMRALAALGDLLWLNILTMVCSIPVFTIGASLSAMHYVLLKSARGEEGYVTKSFFHAFRDNFRQATILWLIWLAVFAVIGTDLWLLRNNPDLFPKFFHYIVYAAFVFLFMIFLWVFPLQMHFDNTIRMTLKNAALLAVANVPRTLLMTSVWVIPAAILFYVVPAYPVVLMFGLTGPGFVNAKMVSPVFARFEPKQEETQDRSLQDDDPELQEAIRELQEARDRK